MPLIVDGYNVLHAPMPVGLSAIDEAQLCRLLARGPWRGDRVVVVCDGAPKPLGIIESPAPEVDLVYSGKRRTADDVIIEMIDTDSAPRRLVIVSDDRQIQKAARRRRARAWSCDQLIRYLAGAVNSAASADDKPAPESMDEAEVNRWLELFGFDHDARIDDDEQPPWWRPDFDTLD